MARSFEFEFSGRNFKLPATSHCSSTALKAQAIVKGGACTALKTHKPHLTRSSTWALSVIILNGAIVCIDPFGLKLHVVDQDCEKRAEILKKFGNPVTAGTKIILQNVAV